MKNMIPRYTAFNILVSVQIIHSNQHIVTY